MTPQQFTAKWRRANLSGCSPASKIFLSSATYSAKPNPPPPNFIVTLHEKVHMPGNLTADEQAFKSRWSRIYKHQERQANGYDDFGEFSAHVAHAYRQEVLRLRAILKQNGTDPGEWSDPIPDP
jgi:hypothetical protein